MLGLNTCRDQTADVHRELLCKALAAIEPATTTMVDEFQAASGIVSRQVAKRVLDFLADNGIGTSSKKGAISFAGGDRLKAAVLALQMGCEMEQVSKHISWKDFEGLASEVLRSFGYETRTNVRLTRPRIEIDVVGVSAGFAIVVDCKHWKRGSLSSVLSYSRRQAARAKRLIKHDGTIDQAVPVILTLHAESVKFVSGGIPVVPIAQFRSFVMDVKGFLPEIYVCTYM